MSWINNLRQVNTEELLEEFILLFNALAGIHLNESADIIL
jgi:hypothetical protein